MKIGIVALGALIAGTFALTAKCQTDWPNFSHDEGGTRYSPLKEINAKTVSKLKLAWTFDTTATVNESTGTGGGFPKSAAPGTPGSQQSPPRVRIRQSKTVPLVIGNTMYFSTPFNRVIALNAETGAKIWEYVLPYSPASRGISYWPGEGQDAPEIFVGTNNGRLIALNAQTGKPVAGFGENGILNARIGVADDFPNNHYGISSPPAIYKNLVITGCQLQEMPSKGPSGDVRAWDVRT